MEQPSPAATQQRIETPPAGSPSEGTRGAEGTRETEANQLPAWLQKLATESWEAELLVSGFAIVGTAQLLDVVEPMAEWLLFHVRADILDYFRWALLYLAIGFVCLPLLFVAHFAVRAFWVGLVGLSSVYPQGIGPERISTMPEAFIEEVRRDYPSLPRLIDRSERVASVMFAVAAMAAMVFVSIALVIAGASAAALLVERVSGGTVPFQYVLYAIGGAFVLAWATSVALLTPALKRRPWAEPLYLRISRVFRKATYTVFEYPATYLQTVLMTNTKWSGSWGVLLGGYLVLLAGMLYVMTRPAMATLVDADRIDRQALDTARYRVERYRAEWPEAYSPVHAFVEDGTLAPGQTSVAVYVPILGEDDYRMDARHDDEDGADDEGLSEDEAYRAARARRLATDRGYYRFEVDGRVVTPTQFNYYRSARVPDAVRAVLPLPAALPEAFHVTVYTQGAGKAGDWTARAALPLLRVPRR